MICLGRDGGVLEKPRGAWRVGQFIVPSIEVQVENYLSVTISLCNYLSVDMHVLYRTVT